MTRALLILLVGLFCVSFNTNAVATTYYIGNSTTSPVGNNSNTGLSPSQPWLDSKGLAYLTNNNTVKALDGTYTGPWNIHQNYGPATLMSLNKWKAVLHSVGDGINCNTVGGTQQVNGITIDGFKIENVVGDGISFSTISSTVQNCWITNAASGSEVHDGINSSTGSGNTIQYNLVEYTHTIFGTNDGVGHGIYAGGPNNIIRGNIVRNNGGFGIHRYGVLANETNTIICYNLTYGHYPHGSPGGNNRGLAMVNAGGNDGVGPGTNYAFGNTFLDGVYVYYGWAALYNNIIGIAFDNGSSHPATLLSDYNVRISGVGSSGAGPHDVASSLAALAFVNSGNGNYFLGSGSTAIGAAKSTVFYSVDFWGNAQSMVKDIGAFQYDLRRIVDSRNLTKPSAGLNDYWLQNDPSIQTQPANQTITLGNPVTFNVGASGVFSLTYQWRRNGVNIVGATQSAYTIASVTCPDHLAFFSVAITDQTSVTNSAVAQLTINGCDPFIITQPQSTSVTCGNTATFTVSTSGGSPRSYQWKVNGLNTGTNSATLVTGITTAGDNGNTYNVTVIDLAGSTLSANATLTVTGCVDPVINIQPTNQVSSIGGFTNFICVASGNSMIHHQWYSNNVSISGATNATYNVTNLDCTYNNLSYHDIVSDMAGSLQSSNATLTITRCDPYITLNPSSISVAVGATATFNSFFSGLTPLTYQWYSNAIPISGATGSNYTTSATTCFYSGSAYYIIATDSNGTAQSSTAILSITGCNPFITSQPTDIAVINGQPAGYSITAGGVPTLAYQWSKNGIAIAGATKSTYTNIVTCADNISTYNVVVTNNWGTITSTNAAVYVLGCGGVFPVNMRVNLIKIGPSH